uniref:Cytochrome b n=1 Tax=Gasteruption parvicollarium TaxID=1738629 RepID=A0A2S0AYH3_9HYME|nr:cytochrome b [Gasteruption parvicollarium]ALJ93749.1 cytochrome b [Gasteruption parvicollarium]
MYFKFFMNKSISLMKKNSMLKIIYNSLINLPSPMNISYWWNFGSLLGLCLSIQIITGFFLSMHYAPNINLAFNSIIHMMHDVNYGWIMRYIHLNGASMYFICMYIHIGRGIYYHSFNLISVWMVGIMIYFLSMATAFLGYVLPWGQMSFWGATVITNLISAIPYLGNMMVEWIWGGFSVENPTLNRFYSLHFILPLIITMMILIHLMYLHNTGSNNPLGTNSNLYKIPFNFFFSIKDIMGFIFMMFILFLIITLKPNIMNDPENFIEANPMLTPIHIQPEWYFLFAYAILRSIPNKLGGVIGLLMSIIMLTTLPLMNFMYKFQSNSFYPINQMLFWMFINTFILLTWIGSKNIELPFTTIGKILSFLYFLYFIINPLSLIMFNKIKYMK